MKRNFLRVAAPFLIAGLAAMSVACNKYDADIDDLRSQINSINATVSQLQTLVNSGSVITGVTSTSEGITFTMSDNSTYTVTNGANGADGASNLWTIGEDGFWYQNGEKTDFVAVPANGRDGADGAPGAPGAPGANGADGENGCYYVPNTVKEGPDANYGNFDIYQDGELVKHTTISWLATVENAMTAVVSGNKVTFYNLADPEGKLVPETSLILGAQLGSVAFVPNVLDSESTYPTTDKPYYHITRHYGITDGKVLSNMVKSNVVAFQFRKNPANAYVENAVLRFVNRGVETRADVFNDATNLLSIIPGSQMVATGEPNIELSAVLDPTKFSANKAYELAALQVIVGQEPVTSDYIRIKTAPIDVVLADTTRTKKNASAVQFYNRIAANGTDLRTTDTDADVKACAGAVGVSAAHFEMKYDAEKEDELLDLKKKVGLFSNAKLDWLASLGFTGMSYEFKPVKEYLASDEMKTNQQAFITLENGVVKVNTADFPNPIVAVGRTPVVRCDAYLTDNAGTKRLVASAYIKIEITKDEPAADKDLEDVEYTIKGDSVYQYRELSDINKRTLVAQMPWTDFNNEVYGNEKVNLPAAEFWSVYGGSGNNYSVTVEVEGEKTPLIEAKNLTANGVPNVLSASGIIVTVNMNSNDTKTAHVQVEIYNDIKTQHTYKAGAKYTMTVAINSDDTKKHPDVKIIRKFSVEDSHPEYTYSSYYYFTQQTIKAYYNDFDAATYKSKDSDLVVVRGKLNGGVYEMSSLASEHFASSIAGETIFDYFTKREITVDKTEYGKDKLPIPTNVSAIEFKWAESPVTQVIPTSAFSSDTDVALSTTLTAPFLVKNMTLTQTLVNGETCTPQTYDVVFVNPFVGAASKGVKMYGNSKVPVDAETAPEVKVVDRDAATIYAWDKDAEALVLTSYANTAYAVAAPTVSYAKKTGENWPEGLTLDTATGTVNWNNGGTTLNGDRTYHVTATVTFANLSVVTIDIPVVLTQNPIE